MGIVKYYSAPLMVAPDGKLIPNKGTRLPLTDTNRVRLQHEFHKAMFDRFGHK